MDDATLFTKARALAGAIEPFAGQVYFSPECHEAYAALGFQRSAAEVRGVAMPDGPAYFTSRGSVLGQVPGELVASAFGVFNPAAVVPAVTFGWTVTDAPTIAAARTDGAVAQLRRILGDAPDGIERAAVLLARSAAPLAVEGRPLYAGMLAQDLPDDALGRAWRLADRIREFRGDAHTASWTSAGFDATEIGLLTELFWGLPSRSYIRTRAWTESDMDAAEARLEQRGLMRDHQLTPEGRAERERVEQTTDRQCRAAVEALGDDFDELVELLLGWGKAIRAAHGYPASGPHDLAGTTA
jgi:hypothetical protein